MITQSVEVFMAKDWDEIVKKGQLRVQRHRMRVAEQYMNADPFPYHIQECQEHLKENLRLSLTSDQLQTLFKLYPFVKAMMMDFDGLDTEVSAQLFDCVANYLLGTEWPRFKDNVNHDVLIQRLHYAAKEAGWEVVVE